jgi:hypothetical protein
MAVLIQRSQPLLRILSNTRVSVFPDVEEFLAMLDDVCIESSLNFV